MRPSRPSMPSQRVTARGANSSTAPRPKLAQPSIRPARSAGWSELCPVSITCGSPGERANSDALDRRNDIGHLLRGLEHDLDAAVLLVAERAVHFGAVGQGHLVGDHERWIDLAVLDAMEQVVGPARHMALPLTEGQSLVHRHPPRDLVVEPRIDAN